MSKSIYKKKKKTQRDLVRFRMKWSCQRWRIRLGAIVSVLRLTDNKKYCGSQSQYIISTISALLLWSDRLNRGLRFGDYS